VKEILSKEFISGGGAYIQDIKTIPHVHLV